MKICHLDYESRSKVDLQACGAFRYAVDESTSVLMAGVSEHESDEVFLWVNPKFETPGMVSDDRAIKLLREADLVYAHNAPFEMALTWGRTVEVGARIKPHQWRCTSALARKAGLPSSLEQCGAALNLEVQKDKEGKRLIKLFSVPQEDGTFVNPKSRPEDWFKFGQYCITDVKVEKLIHQRLKAFELTGLALETFLFDLRMNLRGIPVNRTALENANRIIDSVQSRVSEEFRKLTGLNPTQRAKVLELLQSLGVQIGDMQADTLEDLPDALAQKSRYYETLNPKHRENFGKASKVVELYRKLSYAAVKKVPAMLDWACPDDRMRGVFKYYGAGTGRWSSGGPQLQNAKKPTPHMRKLTDAAYANICAGCDADTIDMLYGEPLEVIASSIRHFVHQPGEEMLDGDYNAIEGRIACWIAGQKDILEDWRQGKDLYKRATAFVENIREDEVTSDGRSFGKVVELACQFGLGDDGFIRTCANWGIECDREKAVRAVYEYYRPTHSKIVSRWYFLDDCMRDAIRTPGLRCGPFVVRTLAGIQYLLLTLPSGRSLAYPHPEITKREPTAQEKSEMAAGKNYPEKRFLEISYWGQLFQSTQWGRVKLHGAKSFENEVQAIAADLMANGAINAEREGMAPFALIHDQGLALRPKDKTADDFARALAQLPSWAKGLPLKVEAKIARYYAK